MAPRRPPRKAGRYTVCRHTGGPRGDHFDLFLEDGDALRHWVLAAWPPPPVARALEGARHRRRYLDYDGPVSRGRGSVRRVEGGTYEATRWSPREVALRLRPSGGTPLAARLACRAPRPGEGSAWTLEAQRRVAAIDIGSNSVKLLVADVRGGRLRVLADRIWLPRLGEGPFRSGRLWPAAERRTLAALRQARAAGAGRVVAAATEAVRLARNAGAFLARCRRALGADVRVLPPRQEARLAFLGATADLRARRVSALDIGGGSTEVMSGPPGRLRSVRSLPLGCVRVLEATPWGDPPRPEEIRAARWRIARALARLPRARATLVGIGGTVATLLRMLRGPRRSWKALDGRVLARAEIERLAARLAALPLRRRARLPGLDPDRADIILPGTWILLEAMGRLGSRGIVARTRGLRHGLALEAAGATD